MNRLFISLIFISSIFSQQTIAVLDFEGIGVSPEEARALSNRFGSEFLELAGYKFTLVERQAMGEILKEQGLQQSGSERASNPHSTQHPLFTNKFAQLYAGEFRH